MQRCVWLLTASGVGEHPAAIGAVVDAIIPHRCQIMRLAQVDDGELVRLLVGSREVDDSHYQTRDRLGLISIGEAELGSRLHQLTDHAWVVEVVYRRPVCHLIPHRGHVCGHKPAGTRPVALVAHGRDAVLCR